MKKRKRRFRVIFVLLLLCLSIFNLRIANKRSKTSVVKSQELVFAHRGVDFNSVENSAESFQAAVSTQFTAIETDIVQTKDNRLVIFHDENCERLLGIDTLVSDVNLSFFDDKYLLNEGKETHSKVIEFSDFITSYGKETIYIDAKVTNRVIADTLISIIQKHNLFETALVADHDIFWLSYIKRKEPRIKLIMEGFGKGKGWLYYIIPDKIMPDYFAGSFSRIDEGFAHFLSINNLSHRYIIYGVNIS